MSHIFKDNIDWFATPVCHDEQTLSTCFYHFMYGLFLPLLNCYRRTLFTPEHRVFTLSRGNYDRMLLELRRARVGNIIPIPDMETLQYSAHRSGHISYFVLDSLETYFFKAGRFCVRPGAVDGQLLQAIGDFGSKYLAEPVQVPEVLIIDRAPGDDGHGAGTRRITNIDELSSRILHAGHSVSVVYLEGKSMAEQISLFRSAKFIIAQHGSALGHIIWMTRKSGVIELVPKRFQKEGWEYFSLLAGAMGIPRVQVSQNDAFEPVQIETVLESLQKLRKMVD